MKYKECLKSRLEIRNIFKLDDEHLLIVHKYNHIHIYNITNSKLITTYYNEFLGEKTTALTYNAINHTLAFANKNVIYIINLQTQKMVQSIPTFHEEVMLLTLMPQSDYIIAGTTHGRVMLYTQKGKIPLARICSFPLPHKKELLHKHNYISAFAVYKDYLATSGYGGDIVIIKVNSLTNKHIITNPAVRIHTIKFIDHNQLLYGNAKGELTYYNLITKEKKEIASSLVCIDFIELIDNNYALIATQKDSFISLFDIEKRSIVKHHYIDTPAPIEHMLLIQTQLLVQYKDATIGTYELNNLKTLQEYLKKNQLALGFSLVKENPLLSRSTAYDTLQKRYQTLYKKALEELLHNNHQELNHLLKNFENLSAQKEELTALQKAFRYYPKFKTLYREKKYPLALSMADKYPQLQQTPQYKKLERIFKEDFSFAQKQLLLKKDELAKEVLGAYLIVPSKKEICSLLLRNNTAFIQFLQALQHKEYKTLFQLAQHYEIFQTIPSFQALQKEIQNKLQTIYEDIETMQIATIKIKLQELQYIPSITSEIKTLFTTLLALEKLLKAYENKDFTTCYEIIDTTPLLAHTKLSEELEERWKHTVEQCELYAFKGDIKQVKQTFGKLIKIETRTESIGNLLRLSFQSKIKQLIAKRLFTKAELLIYSYIDIFGLDTQLQHSIKQYEKYTIKNLAITVNGGFKLSRDSWRYSTIVE